MINADQLWILADIFCNTERLDKVSVTLSETTRNLVVEYEDLDDEWFKELTAAENKTGATLTEPEPSDPTDEELTEIFNKWWYSKGRALAPGGGDEHIRHFTEIGWRSGCYIPDLPNPRLSHPTP